MNKVILSLSILFFVNICFGQNITIKKNIEAYANDVNKVFYLKSEDNGILRMEGHELQSYDSDINNEWEVNFPNITVPAYEDHKGSSTFYDGEEFYFLQWALRGNSKSNASVMSRVYPDGEVISKDLTDIINISDIIRFYLNDTKICMFVKGYSTISSDKVSFSDFYYIELNQRFELVKIKNISKQIQESTKTVKLKDYDCVKSYGDNIVFEKKYFINKKGKVKSCYTCNATKGDVLYRSVVTFNTEFKLISSEEEKVTLKKRLDEDELEEDFLKTDTLYLGSNMVLFKKMEEMNVHVLSLERNEIYSSFMIKPIYIDYVLSQIIDFGEKRIKGDLMNDFLFLSCLYDPINNGIILQFSTRYMFGDVYQVLLDSNNDVANVHSFIGTSWPRGNGEKVSVVKKNWSEGDYPAEHRLNAYDYIAEKGIEESVCTVLNYEDYQILFIDGERKETEVLRINR